MTCRLSRFIAASSLLGLIALAGASATDDSRSLVDDPAALSEPVVQVWGARTLGIKGLFGVHTWIAVKASRRDGLHGLRGHRLAAALERHRLGGAHPRTRPLVRLGRRAVRREARRRRGRADQAHRQARRRLSVRQAVHPLAGAELEHLRRLDHARGARSSRPTCRRPRSARTTSAAACSRARRAAAASSSRSPGCSACRPAASKAWSSTSSASTSASAPPGSSCRCVGRIGSPRIDTALALEAQITADSVNP